MTSQGSPARKLLPPELLIDIFHFLYIDDTVHRKSKGDSSHKLLNLMLVCKSFNHIVQSTSVFWTELCLVRTTQNTEEQEASWVEWILEQITKSGELPLRVFFILSPLSLRKIYPILLPTSPRWVHLTIAPLSASRTGSNNFSDLQPLFDAPIPRLLSLSVRGLGSWLDWVFNVGTVFRHAPKLLKLEWYDRFVVFRPDDGASGTARESVRSPILQGANYDFAQNTLEALSIQGATPPITLEPMVMPRLRFLSLGSFCRIWFLLERWELPVLDELHISSNPYNEVEASGSPTFPALKKIEWFDIQCKPAPPHALSSSTLLAKILTASPKLQCFCLSSHSPSISKYHITRTMDATPVRRITPFRATDDVTGALKYCPNLRELHLQEESFEELEQLVGIRPQLEIVELASLRRDPTSSSLQEDVARLERMKERVDVILHEWV